MTDSPTRGLSTSRDTGTGARQQIPSHQHRSRRTHLLRCEQHAPSGVEVKNLRPLRGRPFGPIPDLDAYLVATKGHAENDKKKIRNKTGG
ncbi:MAG: hypothetical protein M3Z25_19310 [Actinomycetota bacterium]|nr:hypothetical protein [Actinomycetota bacterium]